MEYFLVFYQFVLLWLAFEGAKFSKIDSRELPPYNILLLAYILGLFFKGAYTGFDTVSELVVFFLMMFHLWGRLPDIVLGALVFGVSLFYKGQVVSVEVLYYSGVVLGTMLFVRGVSASIPFFILSFLLFFSDSSVVSISLLVLVLGRNWFVLLPFPQVLWFIGYVLISCSIYVITLWIPVWVVGLSLIVCRCAYAFIGKSR